MTKWIYRAVGTVGVAAGGALLLAGGAAQADAIDSPVNDLRGSLDGFFTPLGDHQDGGGVPARDLAPAQHLDFLGAVPLSPAAGIDPGALEAGPPPSDDLSLVTLGDEQLMFRDALNAVGPLTEDPAGTIGNAPLVKGGAQPGTALPVVGDDPLGALGEDQLTGTVGDSLDDDNLNTIGSDSQMRTLGSTVSADQLGGFGAGTLDALGGGGGSRLGGGGGLGDLGRGGLGGGPLGELTDDPLGAVGKHAAPDTGDLAVADLRGGDVDELGASLVPPLIGEALEAEMPPGFLGGLTEAGDDSMIGLPLVGQLPLSAVKSNDTTSSLGGLPLLDALGGGTAPAGGTAAQPAAQIPAKGAAPAAKPAVGDAAATKRAGHRQWSRSSSERPVAGEDADLR